MKKVLMITCMLVGLAGITVAQTTPSNATTTTKTEKTSTAKGKHKAHTGKHKAGAHAKANKQAKSE